MRQSEYASRHILSRFIRELRMAVYATLTRLAKPAGQRGCSSLFYWKGKAPLAFIFMAFTLQRVGSALREVKRNLNGTNPGIMLWTASFSGLVSVRPNTMYKKSAVLSLETEARTPPRYTVMSAIKASDD
jgi:hypothetical protein